MRLLVAIVCLVCAAAAFAIDLDPGGALPPAATMPVEPALVRLADGAGPTFDANVVELLHGTPAREVNALVLPVTTRPAPATVPSSFEVRASVRLEPGGEGLGIVLMDANRVDADPAAAVAGLEAWDEPNVPGAVGIGLDARNPPTGAGDSSDGDGNVYDRPQREASVHVDGREVLNRQSSDFATGRPVPVVALLRFVPGGALLNLSVAGRPVYVDELLAGVMPFAPRVAIGARSGASAAASPGRVRLDVRELAVVPGPPLSAPFAPPRHVVLFDRAPVSLETSREPIVAPRFGDAARGAARVIATFRLSTPSSGMDKLDRRGALYCHAADGQRYEVFRFRTPFAKEWEWKVDVTDLLPLFRDDNRFGLFIDTWQRGFLGSIALDFYPGAIGRRPVEVTNLWQGEPTLGEPTRPLSAFFNTRTVTVPPGVTGAKVRLTATGHGRAPNDGEAGERLPVERVLGVNGREYRDTLWKNDNYLNPCRPQRGKWATDRAGWGPGSITEPWEVDVTSQLGSGVERTLRVDYRVVTPYENTHVGRGDPPTHWVDGQVIFYADESAAATAPATAPAATAALAAAPAAPTTAASPASGGSGPARR